MAQLSGISVSAALQDGAARLASASDTARLDARLLLQHVTGFSHAEIIGWPDHPLGEAEAAHYRALLGRRSSGEPMAQILGSKEFWGLEFRVTPDTLCPRPDSETLIEHALDLARDRDIATIADLGTGTGCLLAALLNELPQSRGTGIDVSAEALAVARGNLEALDLANRVSWREGDFAVATDLRADLVISNPPYIPLGERDSLPVDVRDHEPAIALFAGEDGLDAYRALSHLLPVILTPGGIAVIEAGAGQSDDIAGLMTAGFAVAGRKITITTRTDLGGHVRAVGLVDDIVTGSIHE